MPGEGLSRVLARAGSSVPLAGRRVLVAAEHCEPNGGTGAHAVRSITALMAAGADVSLIAGRSLRSGDDQPPNRVVPGIGGKPTAARTRTRLLATIDELAPDLVHVQQLPDGDLIPLLRPRSPVVFNVHNHVTCTSGWKHFRRPGSECTRAHGPGCVANLILRGCAHTKDPRGLAAMYRRTTRMVEGLRQADAVVAHSRFVLDQLRANGVERAVLAPLFPSLESPQPSPAPADGPVLYAGRVTPTKGIGTFLRAMSTLDAPVEVCGDGWWLPQARRLAARLKITGRVRFRGWLSPQELGEAYRRSRVVVVPSHWPEPFGLVGIEAMSHGRPVVGTATGGIPEWLEDGSTGSLVAPGDPAALGVAIGGLLTNPALAGSLGARGAERVRARFSPELYLDAISHAYAVADEHWRGSR